MAAYIVHFTRRIGPDYTPIEEYLKSFGTYCALSGAYDTWIIGAKPKSASAIRDYINKIKPDGTDVFVFLWSVDESAWNCKKEVGDWLNSWY